MLFCWAAAAAFFVGLYSAPAAASNNTGACFEYGVDYTGYDILTLSGVGSPSLCMESCAQSSDCAFWSWVSNTSICYLKSSVALINRNLNENAISGPKSCLVEGKCFSVGVDYAGYDISSVEDKDVASAKACQELCAREPQCAFFSYKTSTKGCYLKTSSAPFGSTDNSDVISGPRECPEEQDDLEVPDLPQESCAESSVEFRGPDISVTRNVRSAAYCQQLCASNDDCFYWTFDSNKQTCSQKDTGVRTSGRQTLGKVSGEKDCIPINPGCHLLNTTFLGRVIRQIKGSSTFEACEQNCQNEISCAYFTWSLRTKLCQLRAATPFGFVSDLSTVGIITGPKYCPNNNVCTEQADYVGYDLEAIEDGSIPSSIMCRARCRQTEGCEFWTWVKDTKNCYLKTEDALLGKTNGLASLGKISGPRECFMHYDCMEPNTAYMSSSATRIKNISSLKDCQTLCKQNKSICSRYTYLPSTRMCLLLSPSDSFSKVPFDGALSGSNCETSDAPKANQCLTLGVKYKATEAVLKTRVNSVSECHFECINTTRCTAFTFEEGVGCYLYDKEPSALPQYPYSFPTSVSGTAKCGSGLVGEQDTCYEDEIIEGASFYAYTVEECEAKCTEVPGCMHFTYNPKNRFDSCTLHKANATKGVCAGSRSGSNEVQAATYDFFKYEAPIVPVSNVDSADMCRKQCSDRNMEYWTYYRETKTCHLHEKGNYKRVQEATAMCGTAKDPME